MTAPIPVGLVGAGKHGERYLRHIVEDVRELRLALLCRRNAAVGREQAARVGARFVADYRELATSPEIDAVIAVVPPTRNVEICSLAAGARKAILVEKPLSTEIAGGLSIRSAVEGAGVPLMVAHTLRFDSVVRAVRAELDRLGPVHQLCLSQRFEPSPLAWLDDPAEAGGGNLLHTGVHSFDLLRFLSGESPCSVSAVTRRVVARNTEDNFAAVFSFRSDLIGSIAGSRATAARSGAIEICAQRGQIAADHAHGFAYVLRGTSRTPLALPPRVPTVREALRAFAAMLREGTPPPITLEDGLWSVAMAEACYRSATSGREEEIRLGGA